MGSIRRSLLPAELPFLLSLKNAAVSIWCPVCQGDQVRRSRREELLSPSCPGY
jgi:hypothetical protein